MSRAPPVTSWVTSRVVPGSSSRVWPAPRPTSSNAPPVPRPTSCNAPPVPRPTSCNAPPCRDRHPPVPSGRHDRSPPVSDRGARWGWPRSPDGRRWCPAPEQGDIDPFQPNLEDGLDLDALDVEPHLANVGVNSDVESQQVEDLRTQGHSSHEVRDLQLDLIDLEHWHIEEHVLGCCAGCPAGVGIGGASRPSDGRSSIAPGLHGRAGVRRAFILQRPVWPLWQARSASGSRIEPMVVFACVLILEERILIL